MLLAGCGNQPSNSNNLPSISETDHSEPSEEQKDPNLFSGKFEKTTDGYQALEPSSMMLLEESMKEGTYQASLSIENNMADNGIIFRSDKEGKSYYFYGLNLVGKVVLQRVENGKSTILQTTLLPDDTGLNFAVFVNDEANCIDCYVDEKFLFQVEEENLLDGESIGFKAGGKKTSYSAISVVQEQNIFNNSVFHYDLAHGEFDYDSSDKMISTKSTSMATNNERNFTYGVYEADIIFGASVYSQSGLVFSLSSDKKNKLLGRKWYLLLFLLYHRTGKSLFR